MYMIKCPLCGTESWTRGPCAQCEERMRIADEEKRKLQEVGIDDRLSKQMDQQFQEL